jgi:hypothetical protein
MQTGPVLRRKRLGVIPCPRAKRLLHRGLPLLVTVTNRYRQYLGSPWTRLVLSFEKPAKHARKPCDGQPSRRIGAFGNDAE